MIQDFGPYDELQYFDIFLSIRQLDGMVQRMDNFGMVNTFVTLQDGASPDAVAEKLLDKYMDYWEDFYTRDGSGGNFIWGSTLTRLDQLYFSKIDVYNPLRHGDRKIVEVLLAVALILLISAIFNYINLTVAQTGNGQRRWRRDVFSVSLQAALSADTLWSRSYSHLFACCSACWSPCCSRAG